MHWNRHSQTRQVGGRAQGKPQLFCSRGLLESIRIGTSLVVILHFRAKFLVANPVGVLSGDDRGAHSDGLVSIVFYRHLHLHVYVLLLQLQHLSVQYDNLYLLRHLYDAHKRNRNLSMRYDDYHDVRYLYHYNNNDDVFV